MKTPRSYILRFMISRLNKLLISYIAYKIMAALLAGSASYTHTKPFASVVDWLILDQKELNNY
jgi:hypothetical protein